MMPFLRPLLLAAGVASLLPAPLPAEVTVKTYSEIGQEQVAQVNEADRLYRAGRYREAAQHFSAAHELVDRFRVHVYHYGECLLQLGDADGAEMLFQKVRNDNLLAQDDWDAFGHAEELMAAASLRLGRIYADRQQWNLALQMYAEVTVGPGGREARVASAMILLDHGNNLAGAIDQLEQAERLAPGDDKVRQVLAGLYAKLGAQRADQADEAGAAAAWAQALHYNPGDKAVADRLTELKRRQAAPRPAPTAVPRQPVPPPKPELNLPKELVDEFFSEVEGFEAEKVTALLQKEPRLVQVRDPEGKGPLFHAKTGAVAEALLAAGADPKQEADNGQTPLYEAATREDPGVAQALLAHGAEQFHRDHNGWSPLYFGVLVFGGPTDSIAYLLDHGANVDSKNFDGVTPLMAAAELSDDTVLGMLLAAGADLTLKDQSGLTAADHARERQHEEVAERLRDLAEIGPKPADAMLKAAKSGNVELVRKLLALSPALARSRSVVFQGSPLHLAAAEGHAEVVELFLAQKPDLKLRDEMGNTVLHEAAGGGREAVVKRLLAAGADIAAKNDQGWTPLIRAASCEHGAGSVAVLLAAHADPEARDTDGNTALGWAVGMNFPDIVTLLLNAGCNPNYADRAGLTPLHKAQVGTAALLIAKGANVNAAGPRGTPLHEAARQGDQALLALLLDHGGRLDAQDMDGRTPLHAANRAALECLVARGIDLNVASPAGTPLHARVDEIDAEAVTFLLDHHAQVNARDGKGRTPLDVAMELLQNPGGHLDESAVQDVKTLVDLLRARGAKQAQELGKASG